MSAFSGLTTDRTANRAAQPAGRVQQAIATASRRTGVDFGYLMGQARIESSLNPSARAATSSATGLYQFIDQSWLAIVNDHGAKYGMGWAADAIEKTGAGRYHVADPAMRQQILDLRNHPETASAMAAELASDNRQYLEERIGRPAEAVDLYLAHFLGAGGAAKYLTTMAAAPDMAAAGLFPAAARANAGIFYDRQGNARSLASIRDHFADKLAGGGGGRMPGADWAGGDDLPANARYVQPADYLRIARQQISRDGIGMEGGAMSALPTMTRLATMAKLAAMDALVGLDDDAGRADIGASDTSSAMLPTTAGLATMARLTGVGALGGLDDGAGRADIGVSDTSSAMLPTTSGLAAMARLTGVDALGGLGDGSGGMEGGATGTGSAMLPSTAGLAAMALAALGGLGDDAGRADSDVTGIGSAMARLTAGDGLPALPGFSGVGVAGRVDSHAAMAARLGGESSAAVGALAGSALPADGGAPVAPDLLAGQQRLAMARTAPDFTPRAESARLAYLMLATLGR